MKKILILAIGLVLINKTYGQITKGNWLVGGMANFTSVHLNSDIGVKYIQTTLQFSPNIGYFIADKFAVGIKSSITHTSTKSDNNPVKITILNVGPFLRYYFLPTGQMLNVFAEADYQYGAFKQTINSTLNQNSFSFLAGPVIYFNTSVGLEFTISYTTLKYTSIQGRDNTFLIGVGFQIHLEKE